ncbi:MAG: carboxypeptidase-like regulatory domain-containing protein [Planctomycetes bacterium]|nr:carboxypeptidase-like regulatory domain-containing protein [Planctomycetota bacterium]
MKLLPCFFAATLLVTSPLAGQGPPPPVRTPVPVNAEPESRTRAQPPGARLLAQVFLGAPDEKRKSAFTLTLFGEGLRGERDLSASSGDLPVEGGTGRFEWSIVSPGYDPARGVVTLRDGEIATIGAVCLARGSASLEGLLSAPDGRPVAGAEVSLSGPVGVGERARTKADEAGRFRFEGLAAGKGFVQASGDDLPAMAAVPVDISAGGRHWIELSSSVASLLVRIHGRWDRPFRLSLEDPDRALGTSWKFDPPGWSEDFPSLPSGKILG